MVRLDSLSLRAKSSALVERKLDISFEVLYQKRAVKPFYYNILNYLSLTAESRAACRSVVLFPVSRTLTYSNCPTKGWGVTAGPLRRATIVAKLVCGNPAKSN